MVRTPPVPVNGEVLRWARERVGLDPVNVAERMQVTPERIDQWESGVEQPTLARLRQISELYGQTLAFFMRQSPPLEDSSSRPPDFRTRTRSRPSLALMKEMDRALHRRRVFLEVGTPVNFRLSGFTWEAPDTTGERLREELGIPVDYASRDISKALKRWIQIVEDLGILVFQMSRVDPGECQGLSLFYDSMPIVILNGADEPGVRIFTLFHEVGHLLHRSGALCELNSEARVERECNAFAASFLLPRSAFLGLMQTGPDPLSLLSTGAQYFGVSWSAVAVRARTLQLISQEQLDEQLAIARRVSAENLERRREKARQAKGGPPHHSIKLRNLGPRYVETILDALHDNRISSTDASYYLESKQGVIAKMEKELVKGVAAE